MKFAMSVLLFIMTTSAFANTCLVRATCEAFDKGLARESISYTCIFCGSLDAMRDKISTTNDEVRLYIAYRVDGKFNSINPTTWRNRGVTLMDTTVRSMQRYYDSKLESYDAAVNSCWRRVKRFEDRYPYCNRRGNQGGDSDTDLPR